MPVASFVQDLERLINCLWRFLETGQAAVPLASIVEELLHRLDATPNVAQGLPLAAQHLHASQPALVEQGEEENGPGQQQYYQAGGQHRADLLKGAAAEALYLSVRKHRNQALRLQWEGRTEEAAPLLQALGVRHALAPVLLNPALPGGTADTSPVAAARGPVVMDALLPGGLLAALRRMFAPGAAFWGAHSYDDPDTPFFSYTYDLADRPLAAVESAGRSLHATLRTAPGWLGQSAAAASRVEWWAHQRPAGSAHQLHFDTDERQLRRAHPPGFRLPHPLLSSVVYLSGGLSGGPTLVMDQRVSDAGLADTAWAVVPEPGRVAVWRGDQLHGVAPSWAFLCQDALQQQQLAAAAEPRVTLILAWWAKPNESPSRRSASPASTLPPASAAGAAPAAATVPVHTAPAQDLSRVAEGSMGQQLRQQHHPHAGEAEVDVDQREQHLLPSMVPPWRRGADLATAGGDSGSSSSSSSAGDSSSSNSVDSGSSDASSSSSGISERPAKRMRAPAGQLPWWEEAPAMGDAGFSCSDGAQSTPSTDWAVGSNCPVLSPPRVVSPAWQAFVGDTSHASAANALCQCPLPPLRMLLRSPEEIHDAYFVPAAE